MVPHPRRHIFSFMHGSEKTSMRYRGVSIQGGSNMTGTICVWTSHSLSRSYLNHLVFTPNVIFTLQWYCSMGTIYSCRQYAINSSSSLYDKISTLWSQNTLCNSAHQMEARDDIKLAENAIGQYEKGTNSPKCSGVREVIIKSGDSRGLHAVLLSV